MDWRSASEIVAGMILTDKLNPNVLNVGSMFPPYDKLILAKRAGADIAKMVNDGIPYSAIDAALTAASTVGAKLDELQWVKSLEISASRAQAGIRIRKQAEKLEKGEEADTAAILSAVSSIETGYREMTPMSEIDPSGEDWMLTGYRPFDDNFGGLPLASLTVLAASPGVGKTSLGLEIATAAVKHYKEEKVAIFTLEMTMKQLTKRAIQIKENLTKEQKSRILLSEEVVGVQEVYALASRTAASEPLALIIIDFADQMVSGEQNEAAMGIIYRTLAALAKRTGIAVLLISQLNRETYTGGIPRINHIRYSGLAEAMAALILLVYNPNNIFVDYKDQQLLPSAPGVGYVIEGKSRYGYLHGGPGAVQIAWDGLAGWSDKAMGWFPLQGS